MKVLIALILIFISHKFQFVIFLDKVENKTPSRNSKVYHFFVVVDEIHWNRLVFNFMRIKTLDDEEQLTMAN